MRFKRKVEKNCGFAVEEVKKAGSSIKAYYTIGGRGKEGRKK